MALMLVQHDTNFNFIIITDTMIELCNFSSEEFVYFSRVLNGFIVV